LERIIYLLEENLKSMGVIKNISHHLRW